MRFLLGCAVWAYKGWLGQFYPPRSRSTDFLQLYSQRLTTVEGNTTFYVVPDRETVARWKTQVTPGFEFCLKLPKKISHSGALRPAIPEALAFLEQMSELGEHLGPLFLQLPPGYGPDQWEDLTEFLTAWPHQERLLALEVRHPDWFEAPAAAKLQTFLEDLGVGRVLLDSRPIYECPDDPQLHSERRKPQLPLQPTVTASFSLVRYISHPDQAMNERYLLEWVKLVDDWLRQGIRVYFFVHCPIEERSPDNLRYFQQLLEEHQVPVPPLPWNQLGGGSTQLSLF